MCWLIAAYYNTVRYTYQPKSFRYIGSHILRGTYPSLVKLVIKFQANIDVLSLLVYNTNKDLIL